MVSEIICNAMHHIHGKAKKVVLTSTFPMRDSMVNGAVIFTNFLIGAEFCRSIKQIEKIRERCNIWDYISDL
jgi:hypothetical protein